MAKLLSDHTAMGLLPTAPEIEQLLELQNVVLATYLETPKSPIPLGDRAHWWWKLSIPTYWW